MNTIPEARPGGADAAERRALTGQAGQTASQVSGPSM